MKTKEFTIKVDGTPSWEDAVSLCKDTSKDSDIWKISDSYPKGREEVVEFIAVNFGNDNSFSKALKYAEENNFILSTPRDVFQLAQLDLVREFDNDYGFLVATIPCTFEDYQQACYVWWHDAKRGADLHGVSYFDYPRGWFLFRKPSALKVSSASPQSISSLSSDETTLQTFARWIGSHRNEVFEVMETKEVLIIKRKC